MDHTLTWHVNVYGYCVTFKFRVQMLFHGNIGITANAHWKRAKG